MQNLYFDYFGMDLSGDFSALEKVAKEIYGAAKVEYKPEALEQIKEYERLIKN